MGDGCIERPYFDTGFVERVVWYLKWFDPRLLVSDLIVLFS